MHLYIWSLLGFPRLGRLRTEKASEFFLDPRHPAKMQNALRVRKLTDLLDLIRNWTRTLVGQPKRKLSITHRRIDRFSSLKRLLSLSRKEGGDEKSDRFVRAAIKYQLTEEEEGNMWMNRGQVSNLWSTGAAQSDISSSCKWFSLFWSPFLSALSLCAPPRTGKKMKWTTNREEDLSEYAAPVHQRFDVW